MQKKHRKINIVLFLSIFVFLFFFNFKITKAFEPPIGIPDPGMWGTTHPIDANAPDVATKCPTWPGSVTDNCYYIDNTHPQSTDISNTYGYPDKPRATVPAGTYVAGAYIEVHGGPYVEEKILTMSGTSENPIWFRGVSSQDKPIFKEKLSFLNSTYLFIENLEFSNVTGNVISFSSTDAHHIVLRNSYFHDMIYPGNSSSVISSTPNQGGAIHDMVFYNNLFGDIGDWQATGDDDYHAINPDLWGRTPPTTQYNFWVLNNTGYHISGNLVQFNGDQRDANRGDGETPIRLITNTNLQNHHHFYVGKNLHHHNRQQISSQKFSTDIVVSQNISYANFSAASGGASAQIYQEGANYVWFLFNDYRDSDWGIRQSNTNFDTPVQDALYGAKWAEKEVDLHIFAIGNKISHIYNTLDGTYVMPFPRSHNYKTLQALCSEAGYYTRKIVDNTIFNTGGGFNFVNNDSNTIMSGNVIAGVQGIDNSGLPDYHGRVEDTVGNGVMNLNYTWFQPRSDNGTVTFKWAGATPSTNIASLADLKSSTGQCANCWEGDPRFVDATNYNLHPQSDSPLIGKGIRHSVYDEFESRYGISIAYDFDGNPRPSGVWTLGAFEYVSDDVAPNSPTGLSVL